MYSLVCDGSYEGMLSALFQAHAMRPAPHRVLLRPAGQVSLMETQLQVPTDCGHAQRLQRAIDTKLSATSARHVRYLHASGLNEASTLAFYYLRLGWEVGRELDNHLTHPDVRGVHAISRRVGSEIGRMVSFARFAMTESGIYYAPISPEYDILPLLVPHFESRFADQNWVLHDLAHRRVAMHRPDRTVLSRVSDDARPVLAPDESVDLWRAFYTAIAIEQRINPQLRRKLMPRRYWKHLTEMCETVPGGDRVPGIYQDG